MESEKKEVVNFGRSLIVPSVQELAKKPLTEIPPRYIRQVDQDPPLVLGDATWTQSVPVIDLQCLCTNTGTGAGAAMDSSELNRLHTACKEWGFFQVINHGVSESLLEEFKKEVISFFELPMEEKEKLWQQPDNHEGFGQLFVVSEEQKLDWSDMFYITTLPRNLRKPLFQNLPPILRQKLEAYTMEMKRLATTILDQMEKALKMDDEEMKELFSDGIQSVRMNYYPPCPQPDMAIGFTPHSDADALTILYQLNDIEGLQIRKDGRWVSVKPLPNAFVVNVGDIMEIVSNGVYKSVEHRATVNSSNKRLSVATFHSSNQDSELGPARSLVEQHNVAAFKRVPTGKYFKEFFARKLNGKSYLEFMKLEIEEKQVDS